MNENCKGTEIDMNALGANIQKYRKLSGLTQEQLAERLRYSTGNISKIESGASKPSLALVVALANEFGIGLDQLMFGSIRHKTDLYTAEILRLTEDFPPKKKEHLLRLMAAMVAVMHDEEADP